MPPSKQFRDVPTRQVRLYKSVSEDRLELLLDRFRTRIQQKLDWIGVLSAVFTGGASLSGLWESWAGTEGQIRNLIVTVIFLAIVAYRTSVIFIENRGNKPMSNEDFLNALAEEQDEGSEEQKESVDDASIKI